MKNSKGYSEPVVERFKTMRTDLDAFGEGEIAPLENHGYAICDVAMRRWTKGELKLLKAVPLAASRFRQRGRVFKSSGKIPRAGDSVGHLVVDKRWLQGNPL